MGKKTFNLIEENISTIYNLSNEIKGIVLIDKKEIETVISKTNGYKVIIDTMLNPESTDLFQLEFSNELFSFNLEATITSRGNKIDVTENSFQEHSEGIIQSFKSKDFDIKNKSRYRAFYKISSSSFFLTYFDDIVYETETFSSRGLLNEIFLLK